MISLLLPILYPMLKIHKKRKLSKLLVGIYVSLFFILLIGSITIGYSIADNALYFDIDNSDINAITYLY